VNDPAAAAAAALTLTSLRLHKDARYLADDRSCSEAWLLALATPLLFA